jgi:hypothetical protein
MNAMLGQCGCCVKGLSYLTAIKFAMFTKTISTDPTNALTELQAIIDLLRSNVDAIMFSLNWSNVTLFAGGLPHSSYFYDLDSFPTFNIANGTYVPSLGRNTAFDRFSGYTPFDVAHQTGQPFPTPSQSATSKISVFVTWNLFPQDPTVFSFRPAMNFNLYRSAINIIGVSASNWVPWFNAGQIGTPPIQFISTIQTVDPVNDIDTTNMNSSGFGQNFGQVFKIPIPDCTDIFAASNGLSYFSEYNTYNNPLFLPLT